MNKKIRPFLSVLILLGTLALSDTPGWGAEGIIYRAAAASGDYCHLKFPAILENTLYWDRPVLKDPRDGDIIDYYGSCDHDPLGKEEVMRQRADMIRERNRPRD
jgi:hypothetical protein